MNIICPVCKEAGLKSTVELSSGMPGSSNSFYDEQGKHHCHDETGWTREFRCSNGHTGKVVMYWFCWVPGCPFQDDRTTIVADPPPEPVVQPEPVAEPAPPEPPPEAPQESS